MSGKTGRIHRTSLAVAACLAVYSGSALYAQAAPERKFELRPELEDFWKLVDRGTTLEKVAGGFGFLEGPVWDPRGFLYVSDEINNRISRVFPD